MTLRPLIVAVAIAGCGRIDFGAHPAGRGGATADDDGSPIDPPDLPIIADPAARCVGLPASCGATSAGSCCESLVVPGGSYSRSFDNAPDQRFPDSSAAATVSRFELDKYEVTVGRFRAFIDAGLGNQLKPPAARAGAHPKLPGSGWDTSWNAELEADTAAQRAAFRCDTPFNTWTDAPGGNERRPMNCVSWLEAMAFCVWDGGYLPSEAEWNFAAAAGNEQRAYPWSVPAESTSINDTRTSYWVDLVRQCHGDGVNGCAPSDVLNVGTKPAGDSKYGHSDLGGNVWELVLDWFDTPYTINPCVDCAALAATSSRVVRGGAYDIAEDFHRTSQRLDIAQTKRQANVGFRCARPAAP